MWLALQRGLSRPVRHSEQTCSSTEAQVQILANRNPYTIGNFSISDLVPGWGLVTFENQKMEAVSDKLFNSLHRKMHTMAVVNVQDTPNQHGIQDYLGYNNPTKKHVEFISFGVFVAFLESPITNCVKLDRTTDTTKIGSTILSVQEIGKTKFRDVRIQDADKRQRPVPQTAAWHE